MVKNNTNIICKSVFKSGNKPLVPQFNQKWLEVINQSEKIKNITLHKKII